MDLVHDDHAVADDGAGEGEDAQLGHEAKGRVEEQQAEDDADDAHGCGKHDDKELAHVLQLQHDEDHDEH